MSQKHIEDIVENTVVFLARKSKSPHARDWLWNLYQYEAQFDTSFTAFRQMPLLRKRGVWFRFKPSEVMTAPQVKQIKPGHVDADAFFEPPYVYAEIGSKTWSKWVRRKLLKGRDARKPKKMHIIEVAAQAAAMESKSRKRELTHWWFALIADDLARLDAEGKERQLARFKVMPKTRSFLKLARGAGASKRFVDQSTQWPYSRLESDASDIIDLESLRWWFDRDLPAKSKTKPKRRMANPAKTFQSLDKGAYPTTKSGLAKRHGLGEETVQHALGSSLNTDQWSEVFVGAIFLTEWGPFASLYAARYLAQSIVGYKEKVNLKMLIEGYIIGLRCASQCKYTKKRNWPQQMRAFRPGADGSFSDHQDSEGKATVDYMLLTLEQLPSRDIISALKQMFVKQMLPEYDFHPFFELELIRSLRSSKSKQSLVKQVDSGLRGLAANRWLDKQHLKSVVRS